MAKVRAQRRAERERLAAEATAARAAAAAREARRTARRRAITGWVPRPGPKRTGILAERRRRRLAMTLAGVVAINVLTWCFTPDWGLRGLVLLASVLGAPVFFTLFAGKA